MKLTKEEAYCTLIILGLKNSEIDAIVEAFSGYALPSPSLLEVDLDSIVPSGEIDLSGSFEYGSQSDYEPKGERKRKRNEYEISIIPGKK